MDVKCVDIQFRFFEQQVRLRDYCSIYILINLQPIFPPDSWFPSNNASEQGAGSPQ